MSRWRDTKKKDNSNTKKVKNECLCNVSLLNRFKAFTTDAFMILMPLMYLVFYVILGSGEEFSHNRVLGWIYIFIPHFIIMISFWYFKGQTPGLKAYEISIVNSLTGQRPSIFSLIVRYFVTTISIILLFPFVVPFFNKNRQTLHDIISNTCITTTPNN